MTGNSPSNKEKWKSIWPSRILKLIAVIQIILTVAILALEAGSVGIHPFLATVYAGFYCSLFFTAAWISIFTVSKCSRIICQTNRLVSTEHCSSSLLQSRLVTLCYFHIGHECPIDWCSDCGDLL